MEAEVIKAVERVKSGRFKATAIKVELEAHLSRYAWDIDDCHQYMLDELGKLGLYDGEFKRPLTYCDTYNDGSVDTEFTFTILLDDPKNILLLPKIMRIWNQMCDEAKEHKIDVRGAGMHMAWMNDKNGYYPSSIKKADLNRFIHFQKSMRLALPALYFLATHTNTSRGLEWRRPNIDCNDAMHGSRKSNAIHYKGGAVEFRIFDTCYHDPDKILDNVVVMANCMKFWTNTYLDPGLSKIASRVQFGNDRGRKLERFYQTVEQYALLEAGLQLLKPSYRTIEELKKERNFTLTRPTNKTKDYLQEAELMYEEYRERYQVSLARYGRAFVNPLQSRAKFISSQIRQLEQQSQGDYTLTA